MASALSKKLDQLYLSRAEVKNNNQSSVLRAITNGLQIAFMHTARSTFGPKWVVRLRNSADRKKRSPLGYCLDVLLK